MRHVELDAVEAALARALGRVAVGVDDGVDVVRAQHVDRLPPPGARDLQEVDDLGHDAPGPRVVASLRQIGEPRLVLVGTDAK